MLTRSRARQAAGHSRSQSSDGGNVLKGILKNATGTSTSPLEPCEGILQPEWTGPMTRSRARNQYEGSLSQLQTGSLGFHRELNALKQQNLQLKKGRPGRLSLASAPSPSAESIISIHSQSSTQSSPPAALSASTPTAGPSSSRGSSAARDWGYASSQQTDRSPQTISSLPPRHQTPDILEMLVKAFPLTVPEEEVGNVLESQERPDLTADLKRFLSERGHQHRDEFEKNVSAFRTERPWEPKWLTNPLMKLILTTKARPNIYHYVFDARQREQESTVLEKWKSLNVCVRWTIGLGTFISFLIALCFLIDAYGEEGISFSVPLILFVNIVVNKILANMNSALPSDL